MLMKCQDENECAELPTSVSISNISVLMWLNILCFMTIETMGTGASQGFFVSLDNVIDRRKAIARIAHLIYYRPYINRKSSIDRQKEV